MKKLNFFILLLLVICTNSILYSQDIYKFRAKYVSYCLWEEYKQDWGEWSEYETVNILIVISLEDQRISIYSNKIQLLDFYDYEIKEEYNKKTLFFKAIDNIGERCSIKYVYFEDEDNRQMYVTYPGNFGVVYEIKAMSKN